MMTSQLFLQNESVDNLLHKLKASICTKDGLIPDWVGSLISWSDWFLSIVYFPFFVILSFPFGTLHFHPSFLLNVQFYLLYYVYADVFFGSCLWRKRKLLGYIHVCLCVCFFFFFCFCFFLVIPYMNVWKSISLSFYVLIIFVGKKLNINLYIPKDMVTFMFRLLWSD